MISRESYPVLDKGFVRVIDSLGDDNLIVDAARVSYGKGTKTVRQNQGLINYLMRHAHTSPFEMCEIIFHIKLPIFVARQMVRHRMVSLNEVSARYSEVPEDFYIPDKSRLRYQGANNKQQSSDECLDDKVASTIQHYMWVDSSDAFTQYRNNLLDGLSRELARITLPLNTYTEWYWKVDLHNLLHFLQLRLGEDAQWEIRQYAGAIWDIVKEWVPMTAAAFKRYRLDGARLSVEDIAMVKSLIDEHKEFDKLADLIYSNESEKREFREKMRL